VIRVTATRMPKGGTTGARGATARAWSARNTPTFPRQDFEVMRELVEAAHFTPGLWLLNRISQLWMEAAGEIAFAIKLPEDYVAVHTRFFDLLEEGNADAAVAIMADYIARHDASMSEALAVFG